MRHTRFCNVGALLAIAVLSLSCLAGTLPDAAPIAPRVQPAANYGNLPLYFEPNQGQTDARVRFLARNQGISVFLEDREASLVLGSHGPEGGPTAVVRMKLLGASKPKTVSGLERMQGIANYFRGKDPAKWRTNIPLYARVRYEQVYQGVDVVYYGNGGRLEYDFVVAAGADPKSIVLGFGGASRLRLDGSGDLIAETAAGDLRLNKPVAYQQIGGQRREVEARFALSAPDRVGFRLGTFDRSQPLVIDPTLVYSTFLGGSSTGVGNSIAVDSAGNAYVTGYTRSADFPVVMGSANTHPDNNEVFVVKLNAGGTEVAYSTCLGGTGNDQGLSIGIDDNGNAYIAGSTTSSDFPVAGAVQGTYGGNTDGFAAKLNAQGNSLLYASYLGGSASDVANAIAVHKPTGAAYVAGTTSSTNFPTTAGAYQTSKAGGDDGFVVKLDTSGARLFATFLGGAQNEALKAAAVDANGIPYMAGWTASADFPTTVGVINRSLGGNKDAFVTKLGADGSGLLYSTYFGGSSYDDAFGIAVDASGSAYVTGNTFTGLPTTPGVVQPGWAQFYVLKLSPNATSVAYCTYLGGSRMGGQAYAIAVDGSGNAYVTGFTAAENFPTAEAVQQRQSWLSNSVLLRSADGGADWDDLENATLAFNSGMPAVSVDPISPATLLVGGAGIYRSTNSGVTWSSSTVWDGSVEWFTAFARSVSNPAIVYAGGKSGVYQTTDGGVTWAFAGNIPGMSGLNIPALAVDPATASKVYAATGSRGLYVSTNSGGIWTKIDGGLGTLAVNDIAIDPADGNVLYAVTSGGIYKSANGGANWAPSGNGLPAGTPSAPLLLNPTDSSVLYVRLSNTLYKTTNGGASWSAIKTFDALVRVALAPSNPSVLYAATKFGIYRSTDAGNTWNPRLEGILVYSTPAMVVDPTNSDVLYVGLQNSQDVFVTKLNSTATGYIYSTYLGGSGTEQGYGIAADAAGNTYVTGMTSSSEFPTTPGVYQPISMGTGAFVAKISDATPPCSYVVKAGTRPYTGQRAFAASGWGWNDFVVIAPSGCDWQAVANDPWITIAGEYSGGGRGPGTGTFTIRVAANTGASRVGTVSVGGQTVTIRQAGVGCSYSLDSTAKPVGAGGGSVSLVVTSGTGCLWGVDNATDWLTPDTDSGTGTGTVTLAVGANSSTLPRFTYIFVQGLNFYVSQAGTGSSFNFAPPSVQVSYAATTGSVTVTPTPPGITASAFSSQPWLRITGKTTTSLDYAIDENNSSRTRTAKIVIGGDVFTVTQTPKEPSIGTYNAGLWTLDTNGNAAYDPGVDQRFNWGWPVTTPVMGDWNVDGTDEAGFFINGLWYLDYDGDGAWDGGVTDKVYGFGMAGVQPVVGDWNGDGKDEIGIYINGFWFLDMNGNGVWDGEPTDKMIIWGWSGVTPVIGDWNGDGRKKVGLFYNGLWYLDYNGDGFWDGGVVDKVYGFGMSGVQVMVGDWNGDGKEEVGVYLNGFWYLDMDGNGIWDGGTTDKMITLGWSGTLPVIGDWNGDGKTKVGTFINGYWYLDYNGNGVWDGESTDKAYLFGQAGDTPLVGAW